MPYESLERVAHHVRVNAFDTDGLRQFKDGVLLRAAACYLIVGTSPELRAAYPVGAPPINWPFMPRDWKPTTDMEDLEEAASLILMELERRHRLG